MSCIGKNATVGPNVRVDDGGLVLDFAGVSENVKVSSGAVIADRATAMCSVKILDNSLVDGTATLRDRVVIRGASAVRSNARVYGDTVVENGACIDLDGDVFRSDHYIVIREDWMPDAVTVYRTKDGGARVSIDGRSFPLNELENESDRRGWYRSGSYWGDLVAGVQDRITSWKTDTYEG